MPSSDQSSDIVSAYVDLMRRSPAVPDIAAFSLSTTLRPFDEQRPRALLFSPHPDDECLTGVLPLRLRHEHHWQVINVAVTLGSDISRKTQRSNELSKACAVLGFDCILPQTDAFSSVTSPSRENDISRWRLMSSRIAEIVSHYSPQAVFMPHLSDAHPSHTGTGLLVGDALELLGADFSCSVIQTEYWQPLSEPNLMTAASPSDVAKLLSALSCHVGENARNPFNVRFPSYLIDNVRRGSERVAGAGAQGTDMDFAMLYRIGLWRSKKFMPSALSRILGTQDAVSSLFE